MPDHAALCVFCQLPIPGARVRPAADRYCCYGCRLAEAVTGSRGATGHARWLLARLGVAVFLTMAVMVFSIYQYGRSVYRGDAVAGPLETQLTGLFTYLSLLFATPVLAILGVPIIRSAWSQWRDGRMTIDALVALGVGAAFAYSYFNTLADRPDTYYETGCMILVLVTLGRWLEASSRSTAAACMQQLARLLPDTVAVRRGSAIDEVPAAALRAGDRVLVRPGQRCPVDGRILEGRALVDEQILTGESVAVSRQAGERVLAGGLVIDGPLWIEALRVGANSTLGRFERLLESARHSRFRLERLADRLVQAFVPIVLVCAALGSVLGYQRGGVGEALMSALAVVLIACPCALGIATPLAVWAAMGQAARCGALIGQADALEALARVRVMCFDKTGTLTTSAPGVEELVTGRAWGPADAGVVRALAEASDHVLSRAVVAWLQREGQQAESLADVRVHPGRGVVAEYRGEPVALGSADLMAALGMVPPPDLRGVDTGRAGPIVYCGRGAVVRGAFRLRETLRPDAAAAVTELGRQGLTVVLLTGDTLPRAAEIGAALGVEVMAGCSPQSKLDHLHRLRRRFGPVAMVGDGLNDAPALARADVGIAMGAGADLTREAAAVCLLGDGLQRLPWLVVLARRTVRTIRINLFWALSYNVAGVGLAIAGRLNPVVAAAAMALSSLMVVAHSLQLARSGEDPS